MCIAREIGNEVDEDKSKKGVTGHWIKGKQRMMKRDVLGLRSRLSPFDNALMSRVPTSLADGIRRILEFTSHLKIE